MKNYIRNQSGFTIIEMMVAIVLLFIILGSAASFLTHNVRSYHNVMSEVDAQSQAVLVMNRLANGIPGIEAGTGILAASRIADITVNGDYHISSLTLLEADGTTRESYSVGGNSLSFQRGPGFGQLISTNVLSIQVLPLHGETLIEAPSVDDYTELNDKGEPLTTGVQITVTTQVPAGTGGTATLSNRYYFRNIKLRGDE